MPICVECEYKEIDRGICKNSDLPIDDFVYGTRDCESLNYKGDCKGFKPNSEIGCIKPESVYELKEDEEDVLSLIDGKVVQSLADKGIKP